MVLLLLGNYIFGQGFAGFEHGEGGSKNGWRFTDTNGKPIETSNSIRSDKILVPYEAESLARHRTRTSI